MCKGGDDVKIGNYKNQVTVNYPYGVTRKKVCIDRCIVDEVRKLWSMGIKTNGSCCGHNVPGMSYLGVYDEDIERMIELGYKIRENNVRIGARDSFIPMTIL